MSLQIVYGDVPDATVLDAFMADTVRVVRFVDIYESDNVTPWRRGVAVTDGSVSIDSAREVRRNLDITMHDPENDLGFGPDEFWYDKIIKPYRGIQVGTSYQWVTCLGEFMIDKIDRPRFPSLLQATCRDFTKKLLNDELPATTTFTAGQPYETVIRNVALNGGIAKFSIPTTGKTIANNITFDRGTSRWKIISDLATAIAYEMYFDNYGTLTMRPFIDPATSPVQMNFATGPQGNLINFNRSAADTRLYNHVVVYGDGADNPLVFAEAENNNPASPTRIAKIGRRTYKYASKFISTNLQAQNTADAFLAVVSLEQYEVGLDSIVLPWLEGGDAVECVLPDSKSYEPTRFILPSFSIPLGLGVQSGNAKRVTIVT